MSKSSFNFVSLSGLTLVGLAYLVGCSPSGAQTDKASTSKPPVPVVLAVATSKTVPTTVKATGTVQAYSTVSIKSQVAGQIMAVYFKEGQEVQKGDILFAIDPRPLQAALDQAIANRARTVAQVSQAEAALAQAQAQVAQVNANLDRDAAQARNINVQAQRYADLSGEGVVSREQADQYRTNAEAQNAVVSATQSGVVSAIAAVEAARANVESAQAAVQAADATVDNATTQLSFTTTYAPIDGRTGSLKVSQGNLINSNDSNPLVVISQTRPIYISFSIPQRLLGELKQYQARNKLTVEILPTAPGGSSSRDSSAASSPSSSPKPETSPAPSNPSSQVSPSPSVSPSVSPSPRGSSRDSAALPDQVLRGELTFIDSTVDITTGTIQVKADFPNADGRLTPGQLVNVSLKLKEDVNAIVIPATAVQMGQKGTFVYVVKPDKTVEIRPVTPGDSVDNQVVIKKGLTSGEEVVVDGQFNLTPGALIQEKPAPEKPVSPE